MKTHIAVLALITLPQLCLANIVTNGGFETGDFTGWTLSGTTSGVAVDSILPHTGSYAASLGPSPGDGDLTQDLFTVPGQTYTLSYWLQDEGGTPSFFEASWNGSAISASMVSNSVAGFEYTNYVFTGLLATSSSTALLFTFEQTPAYFHLDDISVTATPEPATFIPCLGVLATLALIRRRRSGHQRPAASFKPAGRWFAGAWCAIVLAVVCPMASVAQGPATIRPAGFTSTMLSDGSWLMIGSSGGSGQTMAAIVDGHTRQIKPTGAPIQNRSWHTATALPDGTVLIAGGKDPAGRVLAAPEIFDPKRQSFLAMPPSGLTARTNHSAILLTDGTVLLAGGVAEDGTPLRSADIWDFRTRTARKLSSEMLSPRSRADLRLLPDGSVLLSGGLSSTDSSGVKQEIYAPWHQSFQSWYSGPQEQTGPAVEGSVPDDQTTGVPTDAVIGLRFSRRVAINSIGATAIVVSDGLENLATQIVPAEEGRLVFVLPKAPLASSTLYRVVINGLKDEQGMPVPYSILAFSTAESANLSKPVIISSLAAKSGRSTTAPIFMPFAVNPANSTSIKGFLGEINGIPPKTIADTVAALPTGKCSFVVTMSSNSLQPACTIAGVQFPRVILDCPGPAAGLSFRPSYLLCPSNDQRNDVEVAEDGQKVTFTLDRDDPKNVPSMVMGAIPVPADGTYKALTEDAVSIFGKDLTTPKNTCQSFCHKGVTNNGANERAWFEPINPVGTARGVNLAPLVVFTNVDPKVYPGANGVPKGSDKKQVFTNVCTAIMNAANQKKVMTADSTITAATLNLMGTLCQNLVAKVK